MDILFKGLNTKKRMLLKIEHQSAFRNHADSNTKKREKKGENTINFRGECQLPQLPHIKCIRLGAVLSSHLPFKMHYVGYVRSKLHKLIHVR